MHLSAAAVLAVLVVMPVAAVSGQLRDQRPPESPRILALEGRDRKEPVHSLPTVQAAFAAEGYHAGSVATLLLFDRANDVTLQLRRVGYAPGIVKRAVMRGEPVGAVRHLRRVTPGEVVTILLDRRWPSGLYFAELTAPGGRLGYAPFVLAPRRLGQQRIAVVLPTQTWQAYNYRDDDGNGTGDTWYASRTAHARLIRPFENRGVPPHYRNYDDPFLRWLDRNRYRVDFLSDLDLRTASATSLSAAYRLLVFEGHHEYVTEHEFDAVREFRDLGGNLMFLSANSFFSKIRIDNGVMTRLVRWRRIGRDEAALVGAHYWGWDSGARGERRWVLRDTPATKWIFRRTGLKPGSLFSAGGLEADHVSPASPRNVQVVAEIPDIFGKGDSAQMTYYRAPSGGQVFAAGAFTLAGSVWQPSVRIVVANLIQRLSGVEPPRKP